MKAFKIIGIIIIVLVAVFFIVALFLPKGVSMRESIVIDKPANLVFKQVNNFRNWPAWSPWAATDPEMTSTYDGPVLGVGSRTTWKSKRHGDGSMAITESIPYKRVAASLDFGQKGSAMNFIEFEETPQGTLVTWGVDIPDMGYPQGRYIALLMPGMMKYYFTEGLKKLKEVTEALPDPPTIQLTQMPEMKVISVIDSCYWSDISGKMTEMFGELAVFMKANKLQHAGYPMSRYHVWDEEKQFTVFENLIPIDREVSGRGWINFKVLPEQTAVMGVHFGAYDQTMYMYNALDEFVQEFGLEEASGPVEEYVTDPMTEPDTSKWQTNIYFPVK